MVYFQREDHDSNSNVATKELYRALSFILDNSSLLTTTCLCRLLPLVANIVIKAKLSPSVCVPFFKQIRI